MKRFILFTLLTLFILTTVMGPFTISSQDAQPHFVNTVNAQLDPVGGVDPVSPPQLSAPNAGFTFPAGPKPEEQTDTAVALNCGLITGEFIDCIAVVVNTMFEFFGFILGGAGIVLDKTVTETVIKMGENVKNVGAIEEGWETFRDLANIILIFAFLAIGIGTILQLENYGVGKLLPTLIIVALLVNFSFFFTRVIIDGGNLLATRTYEQIQDCGKQGPDACKISNQFMDALKLTSLYDIDINTGEASLPALSPENIITIGIMGSFLFLVTTFVFLAAAFLLAIRFVVLIFLIILAPLAFVAMAIPPLTGQARKWWSLLINYTIFAPIYFFLLLFVIRVVQDFKFGSANSRFADSVVATGEVRIASFVIFLNFLIAIIFMVAALFIARDLGIRGGEAALKVGKNLRQFGQRKVGDTVLGGSAALFRGTVGRGFDKLAETDTVKGFARRSASGRVFMKGLRGVAGSSFDVRALPGAKQASATMSLGIAGGKGGATARRKRIATAEEKFARSVADQTKPEEIKETVDTLRRRTILGTLFGKTAARNAVATKLEKEAGDRKARKSFASMERGVKEKISDIDTRLGTPAILPPEEGKLRAEKQQLQRELDSLSEERELLRERETNRREATRRTHTEEQTAKRTEAGKKDPAT